jgi:hypothetical protein
MLIPGQIVPNTTDQVVADAAVALEILKLSGYIEEPKASTEERAVKATDLYVRLLNAIRTRTPVGKGKS